MNILMITGNRHYNTTLELGKFMESLGDYVEISTMNLNGNHPTLVQTKSKKNYDLIISYYYPYILRGDIISTLRYGAINCHPSFLPFDRGVHTNVWPIVDCTPAGVTIHKMEATLDTGNIIAQKEVDVTDYDTGERLYYRLQDEMLDLFVETWPEIQAHINKYGCLPEGTPQDESNATTHRIKDLAGIQDLSSYFTMSEMTTIREFIDIARACTFDGYHGAYITNEDGDKVYYELTPYKGD